MKSKLVPFDLAAILPPTETEPSKLLHSAALHMAVDAKAAETWFRVELTLLAAEGKFEGITREEVEQAIISSRAFPVPA